MGKLISWNSGMSRRDWVRRFLGGLGAATTLPGRASAHPAEQPAPAEQAKAATAPAAWAPSYLDAPQDATLTVLAERIVPGSTRAQVNRFLDLALSADSQENQQKFLAALAAFDGQGLARFGRPFKDLTEAQQVEILTAACAVSPAVAERSRGPEWIEAGVKPSPEAPRAALHEHFEYLKQRIVGAYYSSEIGMKELGWTGNHFFASFPGCQHPEGHK